MLKSYMKQIEKENKILMKKNREKLKEQIQKNKGEADLQGKVKQIRENIRKNELLKYEKVFKPIPKRKPNKK